MLKTLKILCILLKVITRATIAEDLEDLAASDIPVFHLIDVRDYMSSNIKSVQNYSDSVTVKNEVALQEDIISSSESIPSEPTFPRTFVEFDNMLNKKDIFVTFRWSEPEFINGVIQKYKVQYLVENLNRTIQISVDIIPNTILQHKVYDLKPDTMYYFKVQAHNEVGAGPYTKFIKVSITHENPIPRLFINSWTGLHVLDIDLQIDIALLKYNIYKEIVYSAFERKIYCITLMWELVRLDFNPSAIEMEQNYLKIADLNDSVQNLCIDWVARNLYWIQASNMNIYIMKLDLTLWQQMGIVKLDKILKIKEYTSLIALPSTGYLYWSELKSDKNNIIMQSDFDGKNIKSFLEDNICFCPYKLLEPSSLMEIDTTNINKPLMYWTSENRLIATDIYGCRCNPILSAGNQTSFDFLAIDKINIYLYSENEELIYILNKKYVLLESKENAFERVQKVRIQGISFRSLHQFTALDKSLQPYPPTICLTPNMKDYRVEEITTTANSIVVNLPEPIPNGGCEKYNLATTIYNISMSYLTCSDNNLNKSEEFNVQTYKRHYEFQNLTQFTEYKIKLALSNFYVDKLSMDLQFGADVKLTTTGKLNAPEDVTVQVLTPTLAVIYWMPPKKLNCVAVTYEVHWLKLSNSMRLISMPFHFRKKMRKLVDKPERTVDGKFFTVIRSLLPKQKYKIHVSVYPTVRKNFSTDSLTKIVEMSESNNLTLSGVSTNGMNISWISNVNLTIHTGFRYILEYKKDVMQEWQIANNTEKNNDKVTYYIENLLPRTLYNFHLILIYPEYMEDVIRSLDGEFTFKTLGDVPSAPGIPTVTRLPNFTYHLKWEPAQAHESQVTLYRLEGSNVKNIFKEGNQTGKNDHWNLYYNGTDNYWIIMRDMNQKYRFRVRAENDYGFGVWSESSAVVDLTEFIEISTKQYLPYLYNYLPLILSLVVTIVICNVYYFYCLYRQRQASEIIVLPSIINDIESSTSNKTPSKTVHLNPTWLRYNLDKFALTIIEENQITKRDLLGSGAFGKVYQGNVKNLEGSETTPVAIKMLPENASSQEKMKFLEEAEIMSDFRHKHVLKLLGICLDADSPWLILELMEAGDLLQYLRESRTLRPSDPHALRLQDLLAMCEDVARGCGYLEEQHFVHRDLACRNCLISTRSRKNRIVKIGDFGLARDIYKNDYYRMKGETPLPVRWMAPESLKYQKFTSQSDVWAFGVLMWEIMSLGQQPYYARNDIEVCKYVCAGGMLSKPLNCPPALYQLMLSCWNAVKKRSKFKLCLENIVTLRDNIEDAILSSVDIIKRVELPPSEIPEYLQMEDFAESTANCTFERLTANDASNDIIELLT